MKPFANLRSRFAYRNFVFLLAFGLGLGVAIPTSWTLSGTVAAATQDGTPDGTAKTDVETPAPPTEVAADTEEKGLDQIIDENFKPIADWWGGLIFTPIKFGSTEAFKKTDTDDSGTLSPEEYKAFLDGLSPEDLEAYQTAGAKAKFATMDPSDTLTEEDFVETYLASGVPVPFSEVDTDQDGSLSPSERGQRVELPVVLIILVLGAAFFTLVFGFINIRLLPFAVKVVSGKYDDIEKEGADEIKHVEVQEVDGDIVDTIRDEADGEVSHFQALATAVSGTVGLGNIAGVAVAIATGGPGATFWMIVCGLLGMSTKFVECTLGVKYRDIDETGTVHGGPMYYLKKGFADIGLGPVGKVFGVVFAVLCIGGSFGGGNAFQSNQAAQQIKTMFDMSETGSSGFIIGLVMAVLVAVVIIGGIKRIAKVTEKVVPFMAIIYVAAALIIILMNITSVPAAIGQIIGGAFTPAAGLGGLLGVLIQGFQRAAFSNEAGAGSAAIAHSAVKTKYPASEGVVALLEPFIDTVVICTMTALVIVLYNTNGLFAYGDVISKEVLIEGQRIGGVDLTSRAFDSVLPGFKYVLTVAIILFAFSTMISWSYYGLQSWKFLFGRGAAADLTYKVLFCIVVVIGASISLGSVIDFSDAMIFAMVFPNMIGLMFLFPKVKQELKRYLEATKGK